MTDLYIGRIRVGRRHPPILIAGPCVIESLDLLVETGGRIRDLAQAYGFPYILKSSFEKANRTAKSSYRGPGLESGLESLARVRDQLGIPVLTDIHLPEQAESVSRVADCLQIPAFLSRQTALIEAAAATNRPINIKKGQFLSPAAMQFAVDKAVGAGSGGVMVTERGAMFGYGDLVVDMRSFVMLADLDVPVIFDATHSVKRPGGGEKTFGNRRFIAPLARAAAATGAVDGIFLEAHPNPSKALCDADCQLPLRDLESTLEGLRRVFDALGRCASPQMEIEV